MTRTKTANRKRGTGAATSPAHSTRQFLEESQPAVSPGPKFVTLAPLTVRLRHDQVVMLTEIERRIMSQRRQGQRRERITKSTIIRGLIDILPDLLRDTEGISDEGILVERLRLPVSK